MLTKAQERRFESVSQRILTKAERTFGTRTDDAVVSDTRPSPFMSEACYRELEVRTGGLVFRVTVAVGKA